MATQIYSVDKGMKYTEVTTGTGSATTKGMELTIDLAKFTKTDKQAALLALDEIKAFIIKNIWNPA